MKVIEQMTKDEKRAFVEAISVESAARIRFILIFLGALQLLQLILYAAHVDFLFSSPMLVLLKGIMFVLCIVFYYVLRFVGKKNSFFIRHAELINAVVVYAVFIWAILNTFFAQEITSDISIYILVLFATSAIVRMRRRVLSGIIVSTYMIFIYGIPYYQKVPTYLMSHTINGFILNCVALLIVQMFYRYSYSDFLAQRAMNQKNEALYFLSRHDGLTSLYNHETIHELLEISMRYASEKSEPLALLLLDLDCFKSINDQFGHKKGDYVLKQIAETIHQNLRENDLAGRYGGDEFMIILPGMKLEQGKEIAMRLLDAVRILELKDFKLSFSCGIAQWHGESAEHFIENADQAMYRCKENGRNSVGA